MTQDEIRSYFAARDEIWVQVAGPDDGSPAIAWGDTFIYMRDGSGEPMKMPFTTIVTKDYPGFDEASKLDRGGLFRLNINVGAEKFDELFGFRPAELESRRADLDFATLDQIFPHPAYGAAGWISVINPSGVTSGTVQSLLEYALVRALARATK